MTFARITHVLAAAVCLALVNAALAVPGTLIVQQGDALSGSTVAALGQPFTDGNGRVGFVIELADPVGNPTRLIWYHTGVIFNSTSALPIVLEDGTIDSFGVGNGGEFIYSPSATVPPSTTGRDCGYTQNGILAKKTDPAPGIAGQFLTFVSAVRMRPDGSTSFMSGLNPNPTAGGLVRVFYRGTPAGVLTPSLIGGTTVLAGQTIAAGSAIAFNYGVSDNGLHQINILSLTSLSNEYVYLDGALPLHVGDPTGLGDNWTDFDDVGVNNSGNYIVVGNTNGPIDTDTVLAWNGVITAREGDTFDGIGMFSTFGSILTEISINNLNQVAHLWIRDISNTQEKHLFVSSGPNLQATAHRVLSSGDTIDTDGDGIGDWFVHDILVPGLLSGPGFDLAEDGYIHLLLRVEPLTGGGGPQRDAIFRLPTGGRRGDMNCDGKIDGRDVAAFVQAVLDPVQYGTDHPGCNIRNGDYTADAVVDSADLGGFTTCVLTGNCP